MPKIPIAEIKIGFRTRTEVGNIQELAEDIHQHGLLHPLVVTAEKELVAGYRRLKAVEQLGWTTVPVTIVEPQQSLAQFDMQLAENIQRKELNPLEISEAILERKHRFEQVYGEIERGGDHCSEEYKSKVANGEFAFPNFYKETSRLIQMNPKSIYNFLRLNDLDQDLKEQVQNRALNYRSALNQQAERNRNKKQQHNPRHSMKSVRLPNKNDIAPLQKQYQSAPNLMKLFILVQHTFQTIQQMKEKPLEFDRFKLEYLYLFIQQLEDVTAFYHDLLNQLIETQEIKLNGLSKELNPKGDKSG